MDTKKSILITAFYDDVSALSAEKASSAPPEGYLMRRGPAARPAPDLQQPGVEIGILLQGGEVEKNALLISRRAMRNQTTHLGVSPVKYPICLRWPAS